MDQCRSVDVVNPGIDLVKLAGSAPDGGTETVPSGSDVTYTYIVVNTGDTFLSSITITDDVLGAVGTIVGPTAPGIDEPADPGGLEPHGRRDQRGGRAVANPTDIFGFDLAGIPDAVDTDDAVVDVVAPSIAIVKDPASQQIVAGSNAVFTIRVTNTGDVALSNVMVIDALAPDCDLTISNLAVGASTSYLCTVTNVLADFTNKADVVGTPPVGPDVTDTNSAVVDVINPSIALTKDPASQLIAAGSNAVFTITVTNTGDVALSNVMVIDALAPDCDLTVINLAAGGSTTYVCTVTNVLAELHEHRRRGGQRRQWDRT